MSVVQEQEQEQQDAPQTRHRLPKFNNQSNERLILTKHGHFVHESIKVLTSVGVLVIVQAGSCVVQAPGTTKATVKDSIYDFVNVKSVLEGSHFNQVHCRLCRFCCTTQLRSLAVSALL